MTVQQGTEPHVYNLRYLGKWRSEGCSLWLAQTKSLRDRSHPVKLGVVLPACGPSCMGCINKEHHSLGQLGKKMQDRVWKITKAKKDWGMAVVIQCLPSKHKALTPNPSNSVCVGGGLVMGREASASTSYGGRRDIIQNLTCPRSLT
jgi:hypothetical protein